MRIKVYIIILSILAGFFCFSCSCKKPLSSYPRLSRNLPKSVAVLPVRNDSIEVGAEEYVQQKFYEEMIEANWPVQPVEITNATLKLHGDQVGLISPSKLAKALGVEAIVYGRVIEFNKLTLFVYNRIKVIIEFRLYHPKIRKILWVAKKKIIYNPNSSEGSLAGAIVGTAFHLLDSGKHAVDKCVDKLSCNLPNYR